MEFQKLVDYMEDVLLKKLGIPACDIKVMRGHETLFRHTCGVMDYEGTQPLSPDALYYIYSCTKPITVVAALQLLERGIIHMDTPVSDFLPAYKNAFLLQDGKKVSPTTTMTIRHLFTMSAGFDYNIFTDPIKQASAKPGAGTVDIVNSFVESPLLFNPGDRFEYSLCLDVLAAVVEVASGMTFQEYLKKNIFEPLGMHNTGFNIPQADQNRLAAQYESNKDGEIFAYPQRPAYQFTDGYESGGAGLYSCVEDYSHFADALANNGIGITGAQILKPETIDLMRADQLTGFVLDSEFGRPGYSYGLGVRAVITNVPGQRGKVGEFGWDGAAGCYMLVIPEENLSITFAMHVRAWPYILPDGHDKLRDLIYDALGL